jgi:general secretion pathway protein D
MPFAAASAQFITGAGGSTASSDAPWKEFKLNPKDRVQIDFRNSNIDNIISFYEKHTGITIVRDPALTGGLTLTSARPVSLSDALQILSTTLKGYDMTKENNLLVIKARQQRNNGGSGFPAISFTPGDGNSDSAFEPHVHSYKIVYANASTLAATITNVFTPRTGGMNPFQRFGGGGGGMQFQGGGGRFPGGAAGFPGGFQGMGGGRQSPGVTATSDDFSNTVIVNADDRDQADVARLIKSIDQPADELYETKVFKLKYAVSDDAVTLVQTVLTANAPRGRGGATTSQTSGPASFFNAIRGTTPGSGSVTSDPHTNSLIVTATPENVKLIGTVIDGIDKPVQIATSAFVIPLKNAQSDTVQTLLQSAFGNKQGASTQQNRNQTITPVKPGTTSGITGSGTTGGGRPAGGGTPGADNLGGGQELLADTNPSLPIALQDPDAASGPLQTNIAVQGFGGGGLFGGQRQGGGGTSGGGANEVKPNVGIGPNGQVLPYRDLTGQVTIISDPATNQLVIVTSPENEAMLRNVVAQLDKIPEQVMIECVIAEAELDKSDQFGVEWKFASQNPYGLSSTIQQGSTNFGLQSSTTPLQGLTYSITGGNVSAYLNALQANTKFSVLSTPRVFTSNNVESDINISQSIPYVTNTTVNALGQNTYAYAFLDVGVVLTVIPHISNGYVKLEVTQTANDLEGYSSFNAPIVNQREADTIVSVKDGDSVILGGMIQNTVNATVNKIPILGDIPFLGALFSNTTHSRNRTELLIFMTPHIVHDPAEAKLLKDQGYNELSRVTKQGLDKYVTPPANPAPTTPPPATVPKKSGGQ